MSASGGSNGRRTPPDAAAGRKAIPRSAEQTQGGQAAARRMTSRQVEEVIGETGRGERLFIFLDYDGTLVRIRRTPDVATLHPARRRLLERLAGKAFVCVVSGRSLSDIRRTVGIPGLSYAGNHGLEISLHDRLWVHPRARAIGPSLEKTVRRIEVGLSGFAGAFVERKGVTASVHYRLMARRLVPDLKAAVGKAVGAAGGRIVLTEGKKVIELRPRFAWDKGSAVREILRRQRPGPGAVTIYIGDDRTDEDAFEALRRRAVTIRVGMRGSTAARFRLTGVDAVWRLLRALDKAHRGPGAA